MFKIAIKTPVKRINGDSYNRQATKLTGNMKLYHHGITEVHAYHVKSGLKPHTQSAMIKIMCDFRQ